MLAGPPRRQDPGPEQRLYGRGRGHQGQMTVEEVETHRKGVLPRLRLLRGHVHRQHHGLPVRGAGHGSARQRHHPRGQLAAPGPGQAGRHAGDGAAAPRHPRARHPHRRRLPQCLCHRHGHGRLDQLGAAPAGHRPRGRACRSTCATSTTISDRTPHLCKLSPASEQHIEDLYYSGGIGAVMHELDGLGLLQARRHDRHGPDAWPRT